MGIYFSVVDKVVMVTGAASGIGLAFTEIFLQQGAMVSFCDINDDTGQDTLRNLQDRFDVNRIMFQKCNVTNQEEMAEFFRSTKDRFGNIDIVINNAGVGGETTTWERTIDVNLKGTLRGTFLGLEYLRTDKGGRGGVIVNVSSVAGLKENPFSPVYCASKAGIVAFSKSVACNEDIVNNGVRVNVICPAFADTALVSKINSDACLNVSKAKEFIEMVGIMTTQEVAEGLLELVTDDTKNGAILKMSKLTGKDYVVLECNKVET